MDFRIRLRVAGACHSEGKRFQLAETSLSSVVVVDEFQDCKGDHPASYSDSNRARVVMSSLPLMNSSRFLQKTKPSVAVEWLHSGVGKKNILSGNRRTKDTTLLQAADRLRASQDCGDILQGALMSALNANVAAAHVARTICWKKPKDAVILTPTRQDKSPFVRNVGGAFNLKAYQAEQGITKDVGPFRVIWESNVEEDKRYSFAKDRMFRARHRPGGATALCLNDKGALGDVFNGPKRNGE